MEVSSVIRDGQYAQITLSDGDVYRRRIVYEDLVSSIIKSSGEYKVLQVFWNTTTSQLNVVYEDEDGTQTTAEVTAGTGSGDDLMAWMV